MKVCLWYLGYGFWSGQTKGLALISATVRGLPLFLRRESLPIEAAPFLVDKVPKDRLFRLADEDDVFGTFCLKNFIKKIKSLDESKIERPQKIFSRRLGPYMEQYASQIRERTYENFFQLETEFSLREIEEREVAVKAFVIEPADVLSLIRGDGKFLYLREKERGLLSDEASVYVSRSATDLIYLRLLSERSLKRRKRSL